MCNFTQDQSGTLILDRYANKETVIHGNFDDVSKLATDKANLTTFRGGYIYGNRIIKCLQGLVYCITYLTMTRKPVFLAYFDQQERELAVYMACIHRDEQEARKANGNPENFGVNK